MSTKFWVKIFLAIVAVGAWLRFSELGKIPVSLYWDEVAILIDAKSVAQTGLDMHGRPGWQLIFPSYGDYKLPVYIWSSALMVKIFGASDWSIRLTSTLAGLGTIVVAGWIARLILGDSDQTRAKIIQLSTMLVVAFSPWSIIFSRTGFEGHLAQFLLGCSMLLLLFAQRRFSSAAKNFQETGWFLFFLVSSIAMATLATYTYFSVRFVWPVLSITFWLLYWSKYLKSQQWSKKRWPQFALTIIGPLILFGLLLVPMTKSPLYEISNQFRLSTTSIFNGYDYALMSNELRAAAGNNLVDRILFHRHLLLIKELAKNYADHLNFNFLFVSGDANLRHGTNQHGLFLLASLPIFLFGILKLWHKHKRVWLAIIIWWLIALLPASVPETTPHALRSLNALIPLSLIIGFGLAELIMIGKRSRHHFWPAVVVGLIGLNILNFGHFANHYFRQYPSQSAYSWQDGYRELAEIIADNRHEMSEVWVSGIDGRFYLWLMAYDQNLDPEKIQKLPKTDFQLTRIENVFFAPFDWEKLNTNHFKTLLVGETIDMETKLTASPIKPNWFKHIKDHSGTSRFIVAFFGE